MPNVLDEINKIIKEQIKFGKIVIEYKIHDGKIVESEIVERRWKLKNET